MVVGDLQEKNERAKNTHTILQIGKYDNFITGKMLNI